MLFFSFNVFSLDLKLNPAPQGMVYLTNHLLYKRDYIDIAAAGHVLILRDVLTIMFKERIRALSHRMGGEDIDIALITDEDSVYYFTGYYDYLHMEFGRPTILIVDAHCGTLLITPAMKSPVPITAPLQE